MFVPTQQITWLRLLGDLQNGLIILPCDKLEWIRQQVYTENLKKLDSLTQEFGETSGETDLRLQRARLGKAVCAPTIQLDGKTDENQFEGFTGSSGPGAKLVREKLTANNTPSCPCAICLFYFTEKDHFTKTPCFHYFHSNCLGRYILNCEQSAAAEEKENQQPLWMAREKRQLLCPICRESMDSLSEQINGQFLISNPPPEESNLLEDFCASSPDIVALQAKMASLYLLQKSKGGIIDLEEEKNKFLVSASMSVIENQDESPSNEHVEVAPQTSESSLDCSKVASQKTSSNGSQSNTNRRSGDSGTRCQSKKDNSSNQTWWNGRNKHSHKRGGYRNSNGYVRRQTYSYSDQSQMVESVQNQQLEHKNTNNAKFQKHAGADKTNQGRYKNFDCKPSTTKYSNHTDEKNSGNGVEVEKIPSNEAKSMNKGQTYRNYNRGVKAKSNGPPPGYAGLDLTVNSHAAS